MLNLRSSEPDDTNVDRVVFMCERKCEITAFQTFDPNSTFFELHWPFVVLSRKPQLLLLGRLFCALLNKLRWGVWVA